MTEPCNLGILASTVRLLRGATADSALRNAEFLRQWRTLQHRCSYATALQGPGFATAWYSAYRDEWEPILVLGRGRGGERAGLWPLAWRKMDHTLAHAGAHQAEYHAWLAVPGSETVFLGPAWAVLKQTLPVRRLLCKYLLDPRLAQFLRDALSNVEVRRVSRPLLHLDPEAIRASSAKKSNRSRFNRLRRLGELEFRRITEIAELEEVLDPVIDFYDFRQGAVNHVTPFRDDWHKRTFHLGLFTTAPDEVVVTVTYLNGRPIAAYWGMTSTTQTHLGLITHTPFLAEHSPGKLHLMQLSEYLLTQGITLLDLTPGGAWKERFANSHDEVMEAVLHASFCSYARAMAGSALRKLAKQALGALHVSTDRARSVLSSLRRATPSMAARMARNWLAENRQCHVYCVDRDLAHRYSMDVRAQCNTLSDLLLFQPDESSKTRGDFLSTALSRFERDQASVWTIRHGHRLALCGWMKVERKMHMPTVDQVLTLPSESMILYDFYSAPGFGDATLYQAAIGHMLESAFADENIRHAYIAVSSSNGPQRHIIEGMGFVYQGSCYWRRRFGCIRKWRNGFPSEP